MEVHACRDCCIRWEGFASSFHFPKPIGKRAPCPHDGFPCSLLAACNPFAASASACLMSFVSQIRPSVGICVLDLTPLGQTASPFVGLGNSVPVSRESAHVASVSTSAAPRAVADQDPGPRASTNSAHDSLVSRPRRYSRPAPSPASHLQLLPLPLRPRHCGLRSLVFLDQTLSAAASPQSVRGATLSTTTTPIAKQPARS